MTSPSGMSTPTTRERRPIAAHPAGHDVLGAARGMLSALDPHDQHLAVPQLDQMLGRGARAALIVDVHRGDLVERVRVHGRHRQAGPPDLGDLGMIGGQTNRDDAVDGRPRDGPRQGTVQRRDEVQPVARLLGYRGHPRAEHSEEGVGEDHREGLRREQPDRPGPSLGEHPGDRIRPIAERIGDLHDP